jgi:uncharacterized membrane protein YbhN (UPF0104 family)
MNPALKTTLQSIVFLLVGILLFYLAFSGTNPSELLQKLRAAKPFYVALSVISGFLAVVSRGIRWTYLLGTMGFKVKPTHAIHAVGFGYLVNLGVPRAGEVARCTALYKVSKVPVDKMLGTVIVERVIDLIMLGSLMGITILLHLNHFVEFLNIAGNQQNKSSGPPWYLLGILIGLFLVIGLLFWIFRNRILAHPLWVKARSFWSGVKEGFQTVFAMKQKIAFIAHTLFIWFNYYFVVYIVFFALPASAHLSISDGLFIMMSASLGVVVPVPGGGIGAYHYLVTLAMQVLGVDNNTGLAYGTIVHASQTLMLIAAGAVGFVGLLLAGRKILKEV